MVSAYIRLAHHLNSGSILTFQTLCMTKSKSNSKSTSVMMRLCRLQVLDLSHHSHTYNTFSFTPKFSISDDLRLKWTRNIIKAFSEENLAQKDVDSIRDWDLVLSSDGSVRNVATDPTNVTSVFDQKTAPQKQKYPASYQMPQELLRRFDNDRERIFRTEQFAIGSLLYHVNTNQRPYQGYSDEEIRALFARGQFPEDVWTLPTAKAILCHWNPEFAAELRVPLPTRLKTYIHNNPYRFTLQVLGGAASIASVATIPVLGAIGFSALGPVAGSAAAGWQAGMAGAVSAGSAFAWCQSAAMGGAAAVGLIHAVGVSGLALAAGTTALQALDGQGPDMSAEELKEKFEAVWRRFNGDGDGDGDD